MAGRRIRVRQPHNQLERPDRAGEAAVVRRRSRRGEVHPRRPPRSGGGEQERLPLNLMYEKPALQENGGGESVGVRGHGVRLLPW